MNVLFRACLPAFCLLLMTCVPTQKSQNTAHDRSQKSLLPQDHAYEPNIRTVQLYRGINELSYPVIYANDPTPLTLEFDELVPQDGQESYFSIDFVHCDAKWQPTNMLPIEFFEGFSQDRIDIFRRSEFTKVHYFHYFYQFPKPENAFKISGNYLIKVYRNSDPNDLVLTRRFVVADPRILIQPKYLLGETIQRMRLNELAFDVNTRGMQIINPAQDLKVMVLQNFRWDNAVLLDQPRFFGQETYEYSINLNTAFSGGNEFRWHDVRSTRFYSESMRDVTEQEQYYEVTLFTDEPRIKNVYGSRRDFNGLYFIQVQEWPNAADYSADYVLNHFRLRSQPVEKGEVYVFGAFTDWQTRPEYRMTYNEAQGRYEAGIFLKQGVYDYEYVLKTPDSPLVDERKFEGRPFDTENFYSVLIYYRAPTDRSDRLLGFMPVNYVD